MDRRAPGGADPGDRAGPRVRPSRPAARAVDHAGGSRGRPAQPGRPRRGARRSIGPRPRLRDRSARDRGGPAGRRPRAGDRRRRGGGRGRADRGAGGRGLDRSLGGRRPFGAGPSRARRDEPAVRRAASARRPAVLGTRVRARDALGLRVRARRLPNLYSATRGRQRRPSPVGRTGRVVAGADPSAPHPPPGGDRGRPLGDPNGRGG